MGNEILQKITNEIGLIDRLFVEYGELLDRVCQRRPDSVELAAIGAVLHSFYLGMENIFQIVAKRLDEQTPEGPQWHRDLLNQMTRQTERRAAVISLESAVKLSEYMVFRHFIRHAYSFFIDWDECNVLVFQMRDVWTQVKADLLRFLGTRRAT